jgi:hypothetical protein
MNLENLNLVELNAQEVQEVEGGNFGLWWLLKSAWENVGDFRDGFSDGINGKAPRY